MEIIVNNNCSTDDTEDKVLKVISDTPIIYHKNEINLGIVGNVYKAKDLVKGKYFWVVGDDDDLKQGILKKVLGIIDKNPNVSYIFFNYSDISNNKHMAYTGFNGLVKNGLTMITGECIENIYMLFLTSSSVYLKDCLMDTIRNLPLESKRSYGWSGYAALASLKYGDAYFNDEIWVYNDASNKSWNDIVYESNMGTLRMFEKLNLVGYSKKEIREIYHFWVSGALVGGKIIWHLFNTKDLRTFLSDYIFCLRKAPRNVIKISLKLIFGKIKDVLLMGRQD